MSRHAPASQSALRVDNTPQIVLADTTAASKLNSHEVCPAPAPNPCVRLSAAALVAATAPKPRPPRAYPLSH